MLFLLPDVARDSARSARFDNASDFAKTLGREMVAALVPDAALTAHVDYLSDRALSSKAGRLDIGTGAVDISRGRDPNAARPGGDDVSSYADLDAGVYLPPRDRDPFLLTGQRAAPSPVDLAREAGRRVFQKKDVGDALALDAAAAADAARPRQGVGASAFRARRGASAPPARRRTPLGFRTATPWCCTPSTPTRATPPRRVSRLGARSISGAPRGATRTRARVGARTT